MPAFDFEGFRKIALEQDHSEEFIKQTLEYAKCLDDKELPVIFSTIHLAIQLKIPSNILRNLIYSYNYIYFNLKKRGTDSFREIMVPNEKLKFVQRWINYNILEKLPLSSACTGFRPNYSILKNAAVHANSIAIYKIDLLRFFDTITDRRIFGLFKSMGYVDNLAFDLSKICTAKHKKSYWNFVKEKNYYELENFLIDNPAILPQGAPTSPMLANLIATRMDERFIKLSQMLNFRYSRYADDLTFSIIEGGRFPNVAIIKEIISDEGFFINKDKVKYFKRGMKQYVTGLTVTHGTNISKRERREIFKHLFFCKKFGPINHLKHEFEKNQDRQHYAYQDWLLGKISFVYSVDRVNGIKMFKEFEKINWPIDG